MRNFVIVALAMLMAITGTASGQDFIQGEAKGTDAPGAAVIGQDQGSELKALFDGEFIQLSGVGADIFDTAFFQMDGWAFDTSSYSITPSQSAFLKDRPEDGKPLIPAKKAAYVGAKSMGEDPREV